MPELSHFNWKRHPGNPVLPPGLPGSYDCTCCMNPFVARVGDEYRLYYAGGDEDGHKRICLATCSVDAPSEFTRCGVVLDLGARGSFDSNWCVLPMVYRFGEKWHLYYSGRDATTGTGLQSFWGIGLAVSDDGINFERVSSEPIITGDQTAQFPRNRGIAGGGSILRDTGDDGAGGYRMYYTLAVGVPSDDLRLDQEKHCAVCHSQDGVRWTDHRVAVSPRRDVPHEDAACAAPFVWREGELYRMLYSAIGTRWGYYSLAEAVSADGYNWRRGSGDENLSLSPQAHAPTSWESQMVEYACVAPEEGRLRLFYCGNGYGATGIGTATAKPFAA